MWEQQEAEGITLDRLCRCPRSVSSGLFSFVSHVIHTVHTSSYVIANDLSSTAAEAMRRNVEINGLGSQVAEEHSGEAVSNEQEPTQSEGAKVRDNEGDAW